MSKAPLAPYPANRPRRLRRTPWMRDLVRETTLTPSDLIWSLVVHDGAEDEIVVPSMPGSPRLSVKRRPRPRGGVPPRHPVHRRLPLHRRREEGRPRGPAADPDGLVCRAVKAMKDAAPEVGVMCDVALDPFTDHGHDGLVEDGRILNDATIERLVEQGLVQARAGADILAPSDMMDGRIGALRRALETDGLQDTAIMAYAAKYASAFYGPYRDAIGSATVLTGDKKTYQMDPGNTEEAMREVALDISEGADMVMVKPGMPYLDIVRRVVEAFSVPTFAFQVSGEYAMILAAAQNGWIAEDRAILESLQSFKRAGCAGVITYFAPRAARMLGA